MEETFLQLFFNSFFTFLFYGDFGIDYKLCGECSNLQLKSLKKKQTLNIWCNILLLLLAEVF